MLLVYYTFYTFIVRANGQRTLCPILVPLSRTWLVTRFAYDVYGGLTTRTLTALG